MTDNHQELLQKARRYFQADEYDKVIETCTSITAQDPNHHEAHALLGSAYRNIERYSEAIKELTRAIEIVEETNTDGDKERLALWHDERGKCYAEKGYQYQAISGHTRAIEILKEINGDKKILTTAYYGRGSVYAKIGEHNKAIEDFTQVIKILEAITILEKIDDLQKNLVQLLAGTHANRGVVYNKKGQHDNAIDDFTQTINILNEIDDETGALPSLYGSRGVNYITKGFYDEAINDFERAKQLNIDEGMEKKIQYNLRLAKKEKKIINFELEKGWIFNVIRGARYILIGIVVIIILLPLLNLAPYVDCLISCANTKKLENSLVKLDYAVFLVIMLSFAEWTAYGKRRLSAQLQAQKIKKWHEQVCHNLAEGKLYPNVIESMRLEFFKYNLNAITEIEREERAIPEPKIIPLPSIP